MPRLRPSRTTLTGGLAGLLAGTAAVTASEAVAALLTGVTSPLLAVANRAVDWAPRPLKELAIETFGEADKPVLVGSVIAVVALLAAVAGAVGVRRPRLAVGSFVVLVAVAGAAALADRSATAGAGPRLVPVAVLAVVGVASLVALLRQLAEPRAAGAAGPADPAGAAPGRRGSCSPPPRSRPSRSPGQRSPAAWASSPPPRPEPPSGSRDPRSRRRPCRGGSRWTSRA